MSKIKLEVGKTYRSRKGEEVRIVKKDVGQYAYNGSDGEWYTESGRFTMIGAKLLALKKGQRKICSLN